MSRAWSRRGFLGAALAGLPAAGLFGRSGRVRPDAGPSVPLGIKEHRVLGRTGYRVSDIAFGAGSLTNANVLAAALDRGVNYIDTGEHYENGNSERAVGEALKGRDRKSVFITTKLNLIYFKRTSKPEMKERFLGCLDRLKTDYVDCLMIHMCTLPQVKHEPYHELIRELKAEGKVRFSGLSNHGPENSLAGKMDEPTEVVVEAAAEDGRFDIVLAVYNFLRMEAGERIFKACGAKNMGVTLMKMDPAVTTVNHRGNLAGLRERYKAAGREWPEALVALEKDVEARAAAAEAFLKKYGLSGPEQTRDAAIKFCLSRPEVHCVCPTMNSFEALDAYAALSGTRFTCEEAGMLRDGRETFGDITCRIGCGECLSACPRAVPVNSILRYEYYYRAKGSEKSSMAAYAGLGFNNASVCADCSAPCEQACPFGVPIQGLLLLAHERLSPPAEEGARAVSTRE